MRKDRNSVEQEKDREKPHQTLPTFFSLHPIHSSFPETENHRKNQESKRIKGYLHRLMDGMDGMEEEEKKEEGIRKKEREESKFSI